MKKLLKRIFFIFTLHKSVPFIFRFFTSKEISWKKRGLFALLIVGYAAFPLDLINDFLLGIGMIDDVTVIALLLDIMKKQVPDTWEEGSKRID